VAVEQSSPKPYPETDHAVVDKERDRSQDRALLGFGHFVSKSPAHRQISHVIIKPSTYLFLH
jgi:hypothetical protein